MDTNSISPEIISLSWGEVKTPQHIYKDAKLYPGGSCEWDWNETGTSHVPGIQPADLQQLLEHGAEVIILSKGINERLQTSNEAKEFLNAHDMPFHILQTEAAVKKYNSFREQQGVGALIHSTC